MARVLSHSRLLIAAATVVVLAVAGLLARAWLSDSRPDGRADAAVARAHKPPRYRYMFSSGPVAAQVARRGYNLIDVGGRSEARSLPAGTRALLWVGDYDNSTCDWEVSDAGLRSAVAGTGSDPKIAGYFYSDEPDPNKCPQAPDQHKARSALLHSLSPGKFTVMVMDSNSDQTSLRQVPLWVGAADYVGLNPYPCYVGERCHFSQITALTRAADRAGLRYWGVIQAFAGSGFRWPTAREEQHIVDLWARSKQAGTMTFAWTWAGNRLASRPALLKVLERYNRGSGAARAAAAAASGPADEVHYTLTGPDSVAFDWRGTPTTIRYGATRRYTQRAAARSPRPLPFSSRGPFREARLGHLQPGTTYHYAIGGGRDRTFSTAPTGPFRFDVEADIGDSASEGDVGTTQRQIAADRPAFVLAAGDLSYANDDGQRAADRHFNDVMAWSRTAAYMPAWGNHEWDESSDDLRNYKGRFAIPHGRGSPGAPGKGCCGEDWGYFDAGGVRFISYPEPYTEATLADWRTQADRLMAAAQSDPAVRFIVTFGHRPAYSTGYHDGEPQLASILDGLGDRFPKYVVNFNGHSHDYERYVPIHGVVHITTGGGGLALEPPWSGKDPRTAYRAMHLQHVRVDVTPTELRIQAVCGPSTSDDDMTCRPGEVIDSATISSR